MRGSAAPCSCRGLARRASRQALRPAAAAHHAATQQQQQQQQAPAVRRHAALHAVHAPPAPAGAQFAASDAPVAPHARAHAPPCLARRSLLAAAAVLLAASPRATRAAEQQPGGAGAAAAGGSAPAGAAADDAAAATAVVPFRDDANHFSLGALSFACGCSTHCTRCCVGLQPWLRTRACLACVCVLTHTRTVRETERPAAWVQTSKAGASVLFKDPNAMISTLGVTVRRASRQRSACVWCQHRIHRRS
jgi:hypothetical protein